MRQALELGIDIGGTFTDFIVVDTQHQTTRVWKTLTTPDNPTTAVVEGVTALANAYGLNPVEIGKLVHATTLITNALIEHKGAHTALLTTRGFADLIEIGREVRYDLYDIFLRMPEPLVPAERRFEIGERMDHNGIVLAPIDEASLAGIARELGNSEAESLAICFLHSYANPEHERSAAELIQEHLPQLPISCSFDIAGEIREYERLSTTAANAYVQPLAARYLTDMATRLADLDISAPLQVMLSNGGTTTADEATRSPVRLVESGPAAGALIAAHYARLLEEDYVLAFDMGGTTAKLCAVEAGQPTIGAGLEVARVHRFKRSSGLPLKAPSVELIEIGAGGGSIARIDELGLLSVGPDSAGADPGPACYRLGGTEPTVTDADLLLGYLNPDYFLGGEMALSRDAAEGAISGSLASTIGMSSVEIAAGIHDIVNEMMATAASVYIAERGQDPRRYALIATGGAGPAHAAEVARKLGIGKVVIPPAAGVASAGGLLVAPPRLDVARSALVRLDELDWNAIDGLYRDMEQEALETLGQMGIPPETISIRRSVDARYMNQGHEIPVPVSDAITDTTSSRTELRRSFDEAYRQLFGRTVDDVPIEFVTWRTTVRGQDGALPVSSGIDDRSGTQKTSRHVHFRALDASTETPVYRRDSLGAGPMITGPAIVEEAQSTTVIGPNDSFHVDSFGNIIVEIEIRGAQ